MFHPEFRKSLASTKEFGVGHPFGVEAYRFGQPIVSLADVCGSRKWMVNRGTKTTAND
jgi:hypothetical protein